ncbi:serine-threonine protein kinase 19-domain-containing protein [Hyaloraphidium curvatum]|nr:serine-threonine protein kinase 19-domain-containing protein [Hyaloraphidium curvatum]
MEAEKPAKKRRRTEDQASDGVDASSAAAADAPPPTDLSDTLSAILYLRSLLPKPRPPAPPLPKLVTVTMIYGVLSTEPTVVDSEVARLAREGRIRRLILGTGTADTQGSDAVMVAEDYWAACEARWTSLYPSSSPDEDLFGRYRRFLSSVAAVDMSRSDFLDSLPCDDSEISLLVSAGLLTLPRQGTVRAAVPSAALFSSSLSKGRSELLLMLRRRKFHEAPEEFVARRGLRSSILVWRLHVFELLGCGWLDRTRHQGGNVGLRCTAKGLAGISTASERAEKKKGYRVVS